MILAALGYTIAPAYATKNAPAVDNSGILAWSMLITALFYLPSAIGSPLAVGVSAPSWEGWAALVILGVVCSALAFVLYFALVAEVSYSRASLITYLNTAVAILMGVFWAAEPFTLGMALGLPLVAVGSYFASRRHN